MTNRPSAGAGVLLKLYPPIEPCHSGMLDVGDDHQVYSELCSKPAVARQHGLGNAVRKW
jgi:hypothetical protein